ncbi:SbcC/MukB-like Walker B domain-containing protein [Nocardiopsis suaedae]|uniref:SbcC/MukB-like Walker B domain-containing protein n=1 Tax=Nocardiopsis suaedae TaxID=3018444 RepID=A0ABT4TQG9_9ACTN|nr:SbcC/MukB-like Walker B domain-containing protein [Nocardiopsis suaedae]MDA2806934.1 SbcC/MukB-like Walker B domain-containing protein [Nocardiopsis suaedae]
MRTDTVESTSDPRSRWRLHRGGVVNIWQYRDEEFDLSGGRVIFKGTNGSGKSRTLELLLPLCLDGDLRNMGCKGFDTVSMSRLMLDDYSEGTVRLGYAWVELRRVLDDGTEDFCTAGIGVKASASSRQITDSYRFLTPLRVNKDFALLEQDRPITASRLREHIGEDAVVPSQEAFQQRVAETVYGISGGGRYTDLLHLQRTLRNPDIGLKVLQGQLEQLLSDALPPVDPDVIARTAAGLDNLEGVRRNVARLRRADSALQEFLEGYRGYARGVLADREARLAKAEKAADRARSALDKRRKERDTAEAGHRGASDERDALTARLDTVQTDLEALKSSAAYGALGDLEDKEATVASQRRHTEAALRTAEDLRAAEEHSLEAVERAAALPARVGREASAAAAEARGALRELGLGQALGTLPELEPDVRRGEETARVLRSADPAARPEDTVRPTAPAVGTEALAEAAGTAAEALDGAAAAAADRGRLLSGLRAEAERLAEAETGLERLGERAEAAAEESAAADRRAREGEERLADAAERWSAAVREWNDRALPAGDRPGAGELPPVPGGGEVLLDPAAFRDAHREVRAALQPRVRAVQRAVLADEQRLSEAGAERTRLEAELAHLREAAEVGPPVPEHTTAERDPAQGAPFARLVDFAPGLGPEERAGLEAALRASGLLGAWVRADGGIGADGSDGAAGAGGTDGDETWAVPAGPVDGPTLADVLVPSTDGGAEDAGGEGEGAPPVPEDTVRALLRSVPLLQDGASGLDGVGGVGVDDDDAARSAATRGDGAADGAHAAGAPSPGLAVGADGSWRAGALVGRHGKERAEHIGAGAREAARRRRTEEAEAALSALAEREEGLRSSLESAQRLEQEWNACLDAFPDISPVLADLAETRQRRSAAARAASDAETAEAEHARARARLEAERGEHRRSCGDAGLPDGAEALRELADRARATASLLERAAGRLRGDYTEALRAVAASLEDHARTAASRAQAEEEAARTHRAFAEAHGVLETLRSSLGQDAEEVSAQVRALTEERARLRDEAPKAQSEVESRLQALTQAEGRTEQAEAALEEAQGVLADAEDALTDTADVPGVWEAATGLVEVPFERADLRTGLREALEPEGRPGDPGTLERDLISRVQALQTALAGTHDVQADRDRGVLTVAVSDEAGTAPAASTARLTAARLAEAEADLTGGEERVFEEFLLGDVAEELHRQIRAAESLTRRMNTVLEGAHSSQGVRVELAWEPAPHLDPAERSAFALAKKSVAERSEEENDRLRRALMDRIRATRAEGRSSGYAEVLGAALDYREWFAYRVRIHDTGPDGNPRDRRVRQLSSGETRLVSYVTLFAASAAFYDALRSELDGPLRLVLLDEAFERLDDPTIARLLELLVDLDMDWAITWPSGYGVSPRIDRMHIYDILKRKGAWGVACARTTWNGSGFEAAPAG